MDSPKSTSLGTTSPRAPRARNTFAGLMSRCTTRAVRLGEAGRDGEEDRQRLLDGQDARPRESRAKILPDEQLHHEVRDRLEEPDVQRLDEVGVPQPGGHAPFAHEPVADARVVGEVIVQQLDGHRLAEIDVHALEHARGPAVSEETHHLVRAEACALEELAAKNGSRAEKLAPSARSAQ